MNSRSIYFSACLLCFLHLCFASEATAAREKSAAVPAILIFGDSTVDPGNNNYISTPFRSNFSPYGRDFVDKKATGRFTNGRLATDFMGNDSEYISFLPLNSNSNSAAEYLGIKEIVPPYLDPTLRIEELQTGVSFASAGSGFDPLTPTSSNVISISEQLQHFKEYKAKLEAAIGAEKTKELISKAVFIISAGTNDFIISYFNGPVRRQSYTLEAYSHFVLENTRQFLQGLLDLGATRIAVAGLPPVGCVPIVITRYSDDPVGKRGCVEKFMSMTRNYNKILQNQINSMQLQLQSSRSRIAYLDIYEPVVPMIIDHKYGFEEVSIGCCGTGLLEASYLCNSESPVCSDASKFVFWDSLHPTERTYDLVVQTLHPALDFIVSN